jgi:hypothetical protein
MRDVMVIFGAFMLSGFSIGAFHYYSLLVGRAPNQWWIVALLVPASIVIVLLPMIGWAILLRFSELPRSDTLRDLWVLTVLFCWLGPVFVWRFKKRFILHERWERHKQRPQS